MASLSHLDALADRLSQRAELTKEDIAAVTRLPQARRVLSANSYLVREGEPPRTSCSLVLSGMAFRHKQTVDGARQIVSLHLSGDLLDLPHLFLNVADHSIQALTDVELVEIDRDALQDIIVSRPMVAQALWIDVMVESSIHREWVLNVGRRDARARIAHMLCELAVRLRIAGVIEAARFQMPMTQDQLADATGLTSVHVNRTLKLLAASGLIEQGGRWVSILDWEGMRRAGDFNPLYLHLDLMAPRFAKSVNTLFPALVQVSVNA